MICSEEDVPDAQLRAEITTVVAMMKIMEIFVGAEWKNLNGCPAEHITAMPIVGIVYPEDKPYGDGVYVHRPKH